MKYKLLSLLLIPVVVIALHKPTVETKISTSPVVETQQEVQPTTQELAVPQVPTIEPVSTAPSAVQTPESNPTPEPEPQVAPQTTPEETLATHYTATSYGDAGQQEQAEREAR